MYLRCIGDQQSKDIAEPNWIHTINVDSIRYVHTLVFLSFCRVLKQNSQAGWQWLKLRLCWHSRIVCGPLLSSIPLSLSCNRYKAIGGTVHIMKLEKIDLIIGEPHQECSLEDGGKIEMKVGQWGFCLWLIEQLKMKKKILFLRNMFAMRTVGEPARRLAHSFQE